MSSHKIVESELDDLESAPAALAATPAQDGRRSVGCTPSASDEYQGGGDGHAAGCFLRCNGGAVDARPSSASLLLEGSRAVRSEEELWRCIRGAAAKPAEGIRSAPVAEADVTLPLPVIGETWTITSFTLSRPFLHFVERASRQSMAVLLAGLLGPLVPAMRDSWACPACGSLSAVLAGVGFGGSVGGTVLRGLMLASGSLFGTIAAHIFWLIFGDDPVPIAIVGSAFVFLVSLTSLPALTIKLTLGLFLISMLRVVNPNDNELEDSDFGRAYWLWGYTAMGTLYALLFTLLPYPLIAHKQLRQHLAAAIRSITQAFSILLYVYVGHGAGASSAHDHGDDLQRMKLKYLHMVAIHRLETLVESLSSAPPLLSLLPLEGSTAASATNLELTAYYRTLVRVASNLAALNTTTGAFDVMPGHVVAAFVRELKAHVLPFADVALTNGEDMIARLNHDSRLSTGDHGGAPSTAPADATDEDGLHKFSAELAQLRECELPTKRQLDQLTREMGSALLRAHAAFWKELDDQDHEGDAEQSTGASASPPAEQTAEGVDVEELTGVYLFLFCIVQVVRCFSQLSDVFAVLADERLQIHNRTKPQARVSIGQRVANAVLKIPKEKWATAAKLTVAVLAAALIDAYEYDFRSGAVSAVTFVMGGGTGKEGSSFVTTVMRVAGILVASVVPGLFMEWTDCNVVGIGFLAVIFVFLFGVVSASVKDLAYFGQIGIYISVTTLYDVSHCDVSKAFTNIEQNVIAALIMLGTEMVLYRSLVSKHLRDAMAQLVQQLRQAFDETMQLYVTTSNDERDANDNNGEVEGDDSKPRPAGSTVAAPAAPAEAPTADRSEATVALSSEYERSFNHIHSLLVATYGTKVQGGLDIARFEPSLWRARFPLQHYRDMDTVLRKMQFVLALLLRVGHAEVAGIEHFPELAGAREQPQRERDESDGAPAAPPRAELLLETSELNAGLQRVRASVAESLAIVSSMLCHNQVDQLLLHKVHKGVLDARRLSQQFRAQVRRTVHTRSNPGPTVQVVASFLVQHAVKRLGELLFELEELLRGVRKVKWQ